MNKFQTTIAAIATPPGKGGVAILRVSGNLCRHISQNILTKELTSRQAYYLPFVDSTGQIIDRGIALFFEGPNSFTGEDVLELQGHGGPIIMDMLLEIVLSLGAVLAKPGEFSERAFHNDKLDLAQAEAIADLIESGSRQAAKSALRSLSGEFSTKVHQLVEMLTYLRIYVEAAIDFPEEEIDFLADKKISTQVKSITEFSSKLLKTAEQGCLLRDGMTVVIAGKPNAGKSSILNVLAGKESAIVTNIEGTTRDILSEQINIDGLPVHIVDTAGLRDTFDEVEKIGVDRATKEIEKADRVLLVVDSTDIQKSTIKTELARFFKHRVNLPPITIVENKIDLSSSAPEFIHEADSQYSLPLVRISASKTIGIDILRDHLKTVVGFDASESGVFMARRRHVDALIKAKEHIEEGFYQLSHYSAGELLAEELKIAQDHLSEITGEFSSDDLLGKIFTSFCIGK